MRSYAAFLLALLVAGCRGSTAPNQALQPLTGLPRALTAPEQRVVAGSNAFAFGLLREVLRDEGTGNVFVSPISASLALGMTMNGARGATLDGMRSALGFGSASLQEIDPAYHDLSDLLRGLDSSVDLRLANSIWARQGFPITQTFKDDVAHWFDAEASTLDFSQPDAATRINDWVKKGTAGRIASIVDPPIAADVVLYLINATYFKGAWRERFDPAKTSPAPFSTPRGAPSSVSMMHRSGDMAFFEAPDARGVELPYGRGAFVMDVVQPTGAGTVEQLAAGLDTTRWKAWLAALHTGEADLALPRFRLENDRVLNAPLIRLGMKAAFTPDGADFTGMSPMGAQLYISLVRQKTYADVNEEGTEAAAVTSVEIKVTAMPQRVTFTFDRPFLVALRERFSGTVLFLGVLRAPQSS